MIAGPAAMGRYSDRPVALAPTRSRFVTNESHGREAAPRPRHHGVFCTGTRTHTLASSLLKMSAGIQFPAPHIKRPARTGLENNHSSAKWAVHILHIGNDVCIFCISCILFCIFCILHAILSNIMKTCIMLACFAYYFAHFFAYSACSILI
jgi:hypothetical protein